MRNLTAAVLSAVFIAGIAPAAWAALEALPKAAPFPKDNPLTPGKVELGKKLFFDPRLSRSGTVSCNSCHNVMSGGEDGRANSVGFNGKTGGRSTPTVWNAAFLSTQFWDGRAPSLEEQAKGPITNPVEMGMENHGLVEKRIAALPTYVAEFKKVFGPNATVTIDRIAQAIATYERTLITPDSPFDRYVKGDRRALGAAAVRGMNLVQTVGCTGCHQGSNFSGPALPVGQGYFQKFPVIAGTSYEKTYRLTEDPGRFEVTRNESDRGLWRVPTWRNIALTAPYFHNGSVRTLDEAVRVMAKTQLGRDLPVQEVSDIVAFLESLTGRFPVQTLPRLPALAGTSLIEP